MTKTTVKVDKDLVKKAHELGLNVSRVCENALKIAIEQMKKVYGKNNREEWCGRRDLNPGPQRIDGIFRDMQRKYVDSREELRAKFEREGKKFFFVHELCECSFKRKMRLRFPEIERASTFNPRFALGQLVEEALKHRFKDCGEHVFARELKDGNDCYVISGMADVIDRETGVPIEVKYQSSLQNNPHKHHILQLRLYLWLVGAQKGELICISPEGLKTFTIEKPLTRKEVLSLIKEKKSPRWPEWECNYCVYQQFCNKSNAKRK
jgi:CRISPR-associated exonuclease Cas4